MQPLRPMAYNATYHGPFFMAHCRVIHLFLLHSCAMVIRHVHHFLMLLP